MSASPPSNDSGNRRNEFTAAPSNKHILEKQICAQITAALRSKAYQISDSVEMSNISVEEIQAMRDVTFSGLLPGTLAGVATLLFMRTARPLARQWMYRRQMRRTPDASFTTPQASQTKASSPLTQANLQSPLPPPPPPPFEPAATQSRTRYLSGLFLDVLLSLVVFSETAQYFTKQDKFIDAMSASVLRGNSFFGEHFCPVILNEVQTIRRVNTFNVPSNTSNTVIQQLSRPSQNDVDDCLRHPQTKELQKLLVFTSNCRKRAAVERQIKMERGRQPMDHLDNSFPDVPTDMNTLREFNTADGLDGIFGSEFSGDSFVTDMEETARKEK